MIWFTCQQCGKKHARPETASGSMVFCECGQGNTVPWESTAEADTIVVVEELPLAPELAPVKFEPAPPTRSSPRFGPKPPDRPRDRPRLPPRRRDPNDCLNHAGVVREAACADCGEGFCRNCLVYLQAKPLCVQCKNQRLRAMHKALPTSQLALMSLLLALFTGPLAFCLYPIGRGFSTKFSLLALAPQFFALALGVWALRRLEKKRELGGQSLALSAIFTAGLAVFWSVFLTFYAPRLWG